jgi:hypothetical protein
MQLLGEISKELNRDYSLKKWGVPGGWGLREQI